MFDTTPPIDTPYPVVAAIVSTPYHFTYAWPAQTRSNVEDLGAARKFTTRRFVLAPSVSPSVMGGVR